MNREHVTDEGIRRGLEQRDARHRALAKRAFAIILDPRTDSRYDCDEHFAAAVRAEDWERAEALVAAAEEAHNALQ